MAGYFGPFALLLLYVSLGQCHGLSTNENKSDGNVCLGCFEDVNVNATGVNKLTDLAIKHIESENENKFSLIKVNEVKRQVVAGVFYYLSANFGETECKKDSKDTNCPLKASAPELICNVDFFEPLSMPLRIVANSCTKSPLFFSDEAENGVKVEGRQITREVLRDIEEQIIPHNDDEDNKDHSVKRDLERSVYMDDLPPDKQEAIRLANHTVHQLNAFEKQDTRGKLMQLLKSKKLDLDEDGALYHFVMRVVGSDCNRKDAGYEKCIQEALKNDSKICKVQLLAQNETQPTTIRSHCQQYTGKDPVVEKLLQNGPPTYINLNNESLEKADLAKVEHGDISDESSEESNQENSGSEESSEGGKFSNEEIINMAVEYYNREYLTSRIHSVDKVLSLARDFKPLGNKKKSLYNILVNASTEDCYVFGDCYTVDYIPSVCSILVLKVGNEKRQIAVSCMKYDQNEEILAGGISGIDNPSKVRELLKYGLSHMPRGHNQDVYDVLEVYTATEQVQVGMAYVIEAKMLKKNRETGCDASDQPKESDYLVCRFEIWDQPLQAKVKCKKLVDLLNKKHSNTEESFVGKQSSAEDESSEEGEVEMDAIESDDIVNVAEIEQLRDYKKIEQLISEGIELKGNDYYLKTVLSATQQRLHGKYYLINALLAARKTDANGKQSILEENCKFEIKEKLWLRPQRKIKVNCEPVKTDLATESSNFGGKFNLTNQTKIDELLALGISKYVMGSDKEVYVDSIISATQQIVAGKAYFIDALLTVRACDATKVCEISEENCEFKFWEQLWMNPPITKINTNCALVGSKQIEPEVDLGYIDPVSLNLPTDTQVRSYEAPTQLTDKTKIDEVLKIGLAKLTNDTGNEFSATSVISATKQMYSGWIYMVNAMVNAKKCEAKDKCVAAEDLCNFVVWHKQPKVNPPEVTVICAPPKLDVQARKLGKRKAIRQKFVPGGITQLTNQTKIDELLQESLVHLKGDSKKEFTVDKVISAMERVVAGMSYVIEALITSKDCDSKSDCKSSKEKCKFDIWERLWMKPPREIKAKCSPAEAKQDALMDDVKGIFKREFLGGGIRHNMTDEKKIAELLEESLGKLKAGSNREYSVDKVISATRAVVAGMSYNIEALISVKDCDSKSVCKSSKEKCKFDIWERLWMKPPREIKAKCSPAEAEQDALMDDVKGIFKREFLGGGITYNMTDEKKIAELLEESLGKLKAGSNKEYLVDKVISATQAIVAGMSYNIEALITVKDCDSKSVCESSKETCKFKIWERLWMKPPREIKANCTPADVEQDALMDDVREDIKGETDEVIDGSVKNMTDQKKIDELVVESLAKLKEDSKTEFSVDSVILATEQHGAGIFYVIDVLASSKDCDSKSLCQQKCKFNIWERPWLKPPRQIIAKCSPEVAQDAPMKREASMLGGPSKLTNQTKLDELLKESLAQVKGDSKAEFSVETVISATQQVVAGMRYVIEAMVAKKECSTCESTKEKCKFDIWERVWLNPPREITVNCDAVKVEKDVKRETDKNDGIPGGITNLTDQNKIDELLAASLAKMKEASNAEFFVESVISATQQVVAGMSYVIEAIVASRDCPTCEGTNQKCKFNIWERLWLDPPREITVKCDAVKLEKREAKKDEGIPGGITNLTNQTKIDELLAESLVKLKGDSKAVFLVESVISATQQVVQGMNYVIEAMISKKDCNSTLVCEITNERCKFDIWERDWLKPPREITVNCGTLKLEKREARNVLGGTTNLTNQTKINELLEESLAKLKGETKAEYSVESVISATQQVVAGMSYVIEANVIKKDCDSNSACENRNERCKFEIWERLWLNPPREIKVNCGAVKLEKREAILGGTTNLTNQTKIDELLAESLVKLKGDSKAEFSVASVISATQQLVAGMSYVIEAMISKKDCNSNLGCEITNERCKFDIWERLWLNPPREITVNCGSLNTEKREAKNDEGILGGITNLTDQKKLDELLEESLAKLKGDSKAVFLVESVISATQQVVQGMSYVIEAIVASKDCPTCENTNQKCKFEIWERPWLNPPKEITVNCDALKKEKDVKRETYSVEGIPGGTTNLTDQNKIDELLAASLAKMKEGSNAEFLVESVISATQQVVQGMSYVIEAIVASKDCPTCENANQKCKFEIWERPWLNPPKEITVNCDALKKEKDVKRETDGAYGGITNLTDQKKIDELLEASLVQMKEGSNVELLVESVISATQQIVEGTDYVIEAIIAAKDCPACESINQKCKFDIWERPWLDPPREITVNCDPLGLEKREADSVDGIPGGTTNLTDQKKIDELLEESLTQIYGSKANFTVDSVISATQQVVEGMKYVIEAIITTKDCDSKKETECEESKQRCTIDIWEREWLNPKKDVHMNCTYILPERDFVLRDHKNDGVNLGQTTELTERKKIDELLQEGLAKLKAESNKEYSVDKVISATQNVVEGMNYVIEAIIASKDCSTCESVKQKCNFDVWERLWMDPPREITVKCDSVKLEKREAKNVGGIPGGTTNLTNQTKIDELLRESIAQMKGDTKAEYSVESVISATQQVVAGMRYVIEANVIIKDCDSNSACESTNEKCKFEIWERLWLKPPREIKVDCGAVKLEKREAVLGGTTNLTNQTKIDELLAESLTKLKGDSKAEFSVASVISATQQVVAGMSYVIEAMISKKDCNSTLGCEITNERCKFDIWERLWLNPPREITINCGSLNTEKREAKNDEGILGGITNLTDQKKLDELLEESLAKLKGDSKAVFLVESVISATQQVVQGMNYVIEAIVASKDCPTCESSNQKCKFDIWERLWFDPPREIMVKCEPLELKKREADSVNGILGGTTNLTDQHKIDELIEESVSRIYGWKTIFSVDSVISATQQVVEGTNYVIEAILNIKDCHSIKEKVCEESKQKCIIDIWEREWKKPKRDIQMNCTYIRPERDAVLHDDVKEGEKLGQTTALTERKKINELLKEGLAKLREGSNKTFSVYSVLSATQQAVDGMKYVIKAMISSKECDEKSVCERSKDECTFDILERNNRTITVNCLPAVDYKNGIDSNPWTLLGTTYLTDKIKIDELMKESIAKLKEGSKNQYSLNSVIQATKQLVVGMKYVIVAGINETECVSEGQCTSKDLLCKFTILEKSWKKPPRDITAKCKPANKVENDDPKPSEKPETPTLGGPTSLTDQAKIDELLKDSIASLNAPSDTKYTVDKVLSATQQVVSGTKYVIQALITSKHCQEDVCETNKEKCKIDIWERLWLKPKRRITMICNALADPNAT